MAQEKSMVQYIGVYDEADLAIGDLEAFEQLHDVDVIGDYDAAVFDMKDGEPHIVKRVDRPRIHVIPELLGSGPLSRGELHKAAKELPEGGAGLVVIGESTIEKAWDKAVTRAAKVAKHDFDAATDEIAKDLHDAVVS